MANFSPNNMPWQLFAWQKKFGEIDPWFVRSSPRGFVTRSANLNPVILDHRLLAPNLS